jgi:hypothetical protein
MGQFLELRHQAAAPFLEDSALLEGTLDRAQFKRYLGFSLN